MAHTWCPPPLYNLGRATSPPLPSRILTFSSVTLLLDPTCDVLLSLPFFLSDLSLLSLPSTSLHLGILTSPSLLPSLGVSIPPARLFYSTVAPWPLLRFDLWLPSSCPGSCTLVTLVSHSYLWWRGVTQGGVDPGFPFRASP